MKRAMVNGLALSMVLAISGGVASAQGGMMGTKPAAPTTAATEKDLVDTAVAGGFNTLAKAIVAADLVEALKGKGPFTVFAPTDEAFAKLPAGTLESLLKPENKAKLQAVLKYHVVPAKALAADVVKMPSAETLAGTRIVVTAKDGKVLANKANVTKTDVAASNGVIHVIDAVIMPSDTDILAVATGAGKFTTLAKLIEQAGLVDTLKGAGPFTVFAPTDEAFAKLPKATIDALLKPEGKETLKSILTYHVVAGRVVSGDAVKAGKAKTVQGGEVTIASEGGKVKISDGQRNAEVIGADVEASNGVIHIIDTVIMPKMTAKPAAAEPKKDGAKKSGY
jgi:uncharacterized surface protein with fasciclin (FAS1) repeats